MRHQKAKPPSQGFWYRNPHSGGTKIPPQNYDSIKAQAAAHAVKQTWHPRYTLKLRFRGQFCYLDAAKKDQKAFPIGRLRYFGTNEWSLAFYVYSTECYKPCIFSNGWFSTLEDGIDKCSVYLND